MRIRPELSIDFYKSGHIYAYGASGDVSLVYSNMTPRSDHLAKSAVLPDFDHKVVFFGLQGVVKWLLIDLWNKEFFQQPKEKVVARYKRRMDNALGPNVVGTEHIAALHDLGYLPVRIKALPEGSRVNMRVPVWTIVNTLPEFFWLTNYLETQLSAETWKPIYTATVAYEFRRLLDRYAAKTGSPAAFVPWQGHDFSARGMSGIYDAAQSGAGHLLSFTGTDTVSAIDYMEDYYGADSDSELIGGSVPATEHSVISMGGKVSEVDTIRRIISQVYPKGIVSVVSDTWDFWHVITQTAAELKPIIMNRQPDALGFAKVVFRPDSGDPVKVIAGDPDAPVGSPQYKGAVECLWDTFDGTITSTGHKLLDSHVGVIYGDSITLSRAFAILDALEKKGFASANIVFGIGSFTYNYATRDTFGMAIKATFGNVDGEDRTMSKDPATDKGSVKKSAVGLLRVERQGDDFVLYDNQTWEQEGQGELAIVFEDGKLFRDETLSAIRNRLMG